LVLKISTGKLRGKTIASTTNARELRPTQAKVREAIINMVLSYYEYDLSELKVLDIYAGIGTVGFEFISNGAQELTCIEKDPKCQLILKNNIFSLNLKSQVKLLRSSALNACKTLTEAKFDLIFMDPPYKQSMELTLDLIEKLITQNILAEDGLLIFETDMSQVKTGLLDKLAGLSLLKNKKYGSSSLLFYVRH
jgi:16S rRNA (guanine966-N2)-methyltransferase